MYLYSDGNVHGGGVGVVAALALVHVVVGVDRLLAAQHTCTHTPQGGFTCLSGYFPNISNTVPTLDKGNVEDFRSPHSVMK